MAPSVSNAQLASDFASFFTSKISRIRGGLNNVPLGDQFPEIFNHTSSLLMVLFHPETRQCSVLYQGAEDFCLLDPMCMSIGLLTYGKAADFIYKIINQCFGEHFCAV